MIRMLRLAWERARTLSVLQTAYDMPLKHPLPPLIETELKASTAIAINAGGNAYDAAAAFMTMRIRSDLEAALASGRDLPVEYPAWRDLPKLAVGIARTGGFMKFYRQHMDAVTDINRLKATLDAQRDGPERD
jgi:hypothetical protein